MDHGSFCLFFSGHLSRFSSSALLALLKATLTLKRIPRAPTSPMQSGAQLLHRHAQTILLFLPFLILSLCLTIPGFRELTPDLSQGCLLLTGQTVTQQPSLLPTPSRPSTRQAASEQNIGPCFSPLGTFGSSLSKNVPILLTLVLQQLFRASGQIRVRRTKQPTRLPDTRVTRARVPAHRYAQQPAGMPRNNPVSAGGPSEGAVYNPFCITFHACSDDNSRMYVHGRLYSVLTHQSQLHDIICFACQNLGATAHSRIQSTFAYRTALLQLLVHGVRSARRVHGCPPTTCWSTD